MLVLHLLAAAAAMMLAASVVTGVVVVLVWWRSWGSERRLVADTLGLPRRHPAVDRELELRARARRATRLAGWCPPGRSPSDRQRRLEALVAARDRLAELHRAISEVSRLGGSDEVLVSAQRERDRLRLRLDEVRAELGVTLGPARGQGVPVLEPFASCPGCGVLGAHLAELEGGVWRRQCVECGRSWPEG